MPSSHRNQLAKFGGTPVLSISSLKRHNPVGPKSIDAALEVLKSGTLSEFVGEWCEEFYGGTRVKSFEKQCSLKFQSNYTVSVNSWTSGLVAAIGAIGVEPGDEVITTPYTMSATATSILHWNAIPVFVDIDPRSFNIDVNLIESKISDRTKAILAVDIYGQPADMDEINKIAKKYQIKVISDSAQSPGAKYKGKAAGTIADIGGYSFNFHKHIHSGEGGICFTDDPELAENMQLIRNHAEAVVGKKGHKNYINMLGHNFRMGEIEAAILSPQLDDLEAIVLRRNKLANLLYESLKECDGLILPLQLPDRTHSFYTYAMQIPNPQETGVSRAELAQALKAEGVPISEGYQNIHMLPVFQKKIAYGSKGFPWSIRSDQNNVLYDRGICPIAEKFHEQTVIALGLCTFDFTDVQIEQVGEAFRKVWKHYFG